MRPSPEKRGDCSLCSAVEAIFTGSAVGIDPGKVEGTHFAGDVAKRKGLGGLAAVDEITMVIAPDIVKLIGDDGRSTAPAYSPDGRRIAFVREEAGSRGSSGRATPSSFSSTPRSFVMRPMAYTGRFSFVLSSDSRSDDVKRSAYSSPPWRTALRTSIPSVLP